MGTERPKMSPEGLRHFLAAWTINGARSVQGGIASDEEFENDTQRVLVADAGIYSTAQIYHRFRINEEDQGGSQDIAPCSGPELDQESGMFFKCETCQTREGSLPEDFGSNLEKDISLTEEPLLFDPPNQGPETNPEAGVGDACANQIDSDGFWAREMPDYTALASQNVGIIPQIAFVCQRSELCACTNESCRNISEEMNLIAPHPSQDMLEWDSFRQWAITIMACQQNMRNQWLSGFNESIPAARGTHEGHTHISSVVATLAMILSECHRACYESNDLLESQSESNVSQQVTHAIEVIYWMVGIQYNYAIGPDSFGRWGANTLAEQLSSNSMIAGKAQERTESLFLCKYRLWKFVEVCDRTEGDLANIVSYLEWHHDSMLTVQAPISEDTPWQHLHCTPGFCHQASMDTTKVSQKHVCGVEPVGGDVPVEDSIWFDMTMLLRYLNMQIITIWPCDTSTNPQETQRLVDTNSDPDHPYIAISHVWSDGTGVGLSKTDGHGRRRINLCLWKYWQSLVQHAWSELEVQGDAAIWWDTICIPDGEGKAKALQTMQRNFSGAECTIVYDRKLAETFFETTAELCVALVMSDWFSRGWTALELQLSKKVLVVTIDERGEPVLRDLDKYILAKSPAESPPVHWMATSWIRRIREPVNDVGDIIHMLNSRALTRRKDRHKIAAILADVPKIDFEKEDEVYIAKEILMFLGKIPASCLLHGSPTMSDSGGWSWCAADLFAMPAPPPISVESRKMSDVLSMLDVSIDGVVSGLWHWRFLTAADDIQPLSDDLSSRVKIRYHQMWYEDCILLRLHTPIHLQKDDPALLVRVMPLSDPDQAQDGTTTFFVTYVGAVRELTHSDASDWGVQKVVMGSNLPDETFGGSGDRDISSVEDPDLQGGDDLPQEDASTLDDGPFQQLAVSMRRGSTGATTYILAKLLAHGNPPDESFVKAMYAWALHKNSEEPDGRSAFNTINGLWALGDFYLNSQDWGAAYFAYYAARVAGVAVNPGAMNDPDIPLYVVEMVIYQEGLANILQGEQGFETSPPLFLRAYQRTRERLDQDENAKRQQRISQQQKCMRPAELEGCYWIQSSTLGALLLLDLQGFPAQLTVEVPHRPTTYFIASFRNIEANQVSVLSREIIEFSLTPHPGGEGVTFASHEDFPDEKSFVTELNLAIYTLHQVMQKFNSVFRENHILRCVSQLCAGVSLCIPQSNDWFSLIDGWRFLKKASDGLQMLLPNVYDESPQQVVWQLQLIVDSHLDYCDMLLTSMMHQRAEEQRLAEEQGPGEEQEIDHEQTQTGAVQEA